jgi:hypothetical protein
MPVSTTNVECPLTIRPGLEVLQNAPTLCEVDESWGRIELKLETTDTRYWVTTRGLTRKSREAPINYVVNYVTVERRTADGRWDLSAVFSPEAWKLSQAFDYCQMLYRDLRMLKARLEDAFSWELRQQIDEVGHELERVNQVMLALSEKVSASGG